MTATHLSTSNSSWPELNYNDWSETLKTLHQWTQIVGKIRLVAMPWQNHSWHTSLYITARGLTTGSIPWQDGIFEIEFDFNEHLLRVNTSYEQQRTLELKPRSVADFYSNLFQLLAEVGIEVDIYARPNEVAEAIPFAENAINCSYDKKKVADFWQVAIKTHNVFTKFRSDFVGKCSPVHFFWGAFDIAVTRFSGRKAPLHQGSMPNMPKEVMQEAYSQEVSSCGFWPGSDAFPVPAFYAYCYPSPEAFSKQEVKPDNVFWSDEMGEFFLKYDDVRQAADPDKMLMEFLQTTYDAAANTGNWDRQALER